jgi:hypothetical protein
MSFRRSDLQEAFLVAGTHGFRVWGYGTTDSLDEVLAEHYFRDANAVLQPSELIYVSMKPRARADRPEREDVRVALVMVRRCERGTASVRLVQDFGGPNDPSATPGPAKRGRGRPPGSRTKKPT